MQKVKVVSTGKRSDGLNYAVVQKEVEGFHVTAICNPVEMPEVGDELQIPEGIELNWQA